MKNWILAFAFSILSPSLSFASGEGEERQEILSKAASYLQVSAQQLEEEDNQGNVEITYLNGNDNEEVYEVRYSGGHVIISIDPVL